MMKAALQMKRIDKRADLDEKEELQVFTTMIKQRKDSIEQFEKGNRPELAQKEAAGDRHHRSLHAQGRSAKRRSSPRCARSSPRWALPQ